MQSHPRPSQEIAEAMMRRIERANGVNIWHSLFAPVTELAHDRADHPGYEDVILTHAAPNNIAAAPYKVAYRDALLGVCSDSRGVS
jgi:hypothetical protein